MSTVIEPEVMPQFPGCLIDVYDTMEDWLAARHNVIGASESPAVFGVGYANESPLTVWERKIGKVRDMPDEDLLECGKVLQPSIIELFRRRYARANKLELAQFHIETLGEYSLCRSRTHPWLAASLDAHFFHDSLALVETKNLSVFAASESDFDEEEDGPKLRTQVQVQHQLAVTGAERAFIVGLIGGNKLRWKEVKRNDSFIAAMIQRLSEFRRYIVEGIEPPVKGPDDTFDGSEATKKALGRLHPNDNGETTVLNFDANEWAKELKDVKPRFKALEERKKGLENALKQAIGDNTYGLLFDGTRYSLKSQKNGGFWMPESYPRYLRYEKGKGKPQSSRRK